MHERSLTGNWEFRFEDEPDWRTLAVPGCWELLADVPKNRSGPAWYRLVTEIPGALRSGRLWLAFDGVSYDCQVWVNGTEVGRHTGLWDAFRIEITNAVGLQAHALIEVRVEKPASLTAGPESPPVAGNFPLPETLAGFLPYVWGHIFGGIWQDVRLVATGQVVFTHVHARGTAVGALHIEAGLPTPATVHCQVSDPSGRILWTMTCDGTEQVLFEAQLADPLPWSLTAPMLYEARLRIDDGDERVMRFGLRSLRADGTTLLLNERPLYPRLALSWGWYPDALHSNPGPERVRADFAQLRALGYNGVKLCLWVPPQYYFDLADELGLLLWLELPLWLPQPTPFFRAQTPVEYEHIMRAARNHPSVILYTLGCELNAEIGADLLEPLYALAKRLAGDALVRDNSGSGEAYGGLLNEYADYYDYHFYSDIQFLRPLLDLFAPRWRPELPWLFGEFCDLDTFRDLRRLYASNGGVPPWWTVSDDRQNPQGARWQFDIVATEQRLRANGFWERGTELEHISQAQGLLHRKWTFELVRSYREIGGYVVTGEVDTPISTAGMLNDLGELKFDAAAFRQANADLVVLVGWDKRRTWLGGGDRVAPWDNWSYPAGAIVRAHLIASHYGTAHGPAHITWRVVWHDGAILADGAATSPFALTPGTVAEVHIAELRVPELDAPSRASLEVDLQIGDETATNRWPLWFFPAEPWRANEHVTLADPSGRLHDLPHLAPAPQLPPSAPVRPVLIATSWLPEVELHLASGGAAILLQSGSGPAGPVGTVEMPFWREAIKVIEPHPAWGDFPHDGYVDLQFFGCATDHALDTGTLEQARPILRRLDVRTMAVHDYATEIPWGAGRLIVSTLRFEGGLGEQPLGIIRNTAAAYLLSCWVRYLATSLAPGSP
ncbi:MAG: glycoside hydrolase [Herpetosiphonaceae bacterium]|nr:glycoside hydrolase [Herpetosiphonaceae bacterium]